MKVNDENSRIRIQDPDPLVRSMDPRIRIRIHPKMSWIRNTGFLRPCIFQGFSQIIYVGTVPHYKKVGDYVLIGRIRRNQYCGSALFSMKGSGSSILGQYRFGSYPDLDPGFYEKLQFYHNGRPIYRRSLQP